MTTTFAAKITLFLCMMGLAYAQPSQLSVTASPPPAATPGARVIGSQTGGQTLYYWVVAHYPIGNVFSALVQINNTVGATNLNATNFVTVSWAGLPNATAYDVLRGTTPSFPAPCTACAVAVGTTSTSVNDQGGGSAYTQSNAPVSPALGTFALDNVHESAPYMTLGINGVLNRVGWGQGTTLPGTCTVGWTFFNTAAAAGANWYGCTSTNTWTVLSGGGGVSNFFASCTATAPAFSATPTFALAGAPSPCIIQPGAMTANVNPAGFSGLSAGQEFHILWKEGAGANNHFTVTYAAGVINACQPTVGDNITTDQSFLVLNDGVTVRGNGCNNDATGTQISGPTGVCPAGAQPAATLNLCFDSAKNNASVTNSAGTVSEMVVGIANPADGQFIQYIDVNGVQQRGAAAGGGTVTSVSFTGGLISVANPTTTPALTVAGTSGGVPYFSAASTWASSGALTQYGFLFGGGAGGSPTSSAQCAANTLPHGQGAGNPTCSNIVNADIANTTIDLTAKVTGLLPAANLVNSGVFTGDATTTFPALTIGNGAITAVKMVNAGVFTGDATTTFPAVTIGNGAITAVKMVNAGVFTGDVTTTFPAVTVARVNGITYSATAAAHSVEVITTANTTATAKVIPDCTDSAGNHINYTQSTDAFSCGTSSKITIGTTTITSGTTLRVLYDNAGVVGESANFIFNDAVPRLTVNGQIYAANTGYFIAQGTAASPAYADANNGGNGMWFTGNVVAFSTAGSESGRFTTTIFQVNTGFASVGTKFTASGCSNGTLVGGATAGKFTLGANNCTVTVTMGSSATSANGWNCPPEDQTTASLTAGVYQSASSTTTVTFTIPATAGATDVISFGCIGY